MHATLSPPAFSPASRAPSLFERLQRSPLYRNYQTAFEVSTGLPLVLRPVGSFQFPLPGSKRTQPFYLVAARHNRWCAACLRFEDWLEHAAEAAPATLPGIAGLVESAIPVRVGSRVIAHLRTGQILHAAPHPENLQALQRELDGPDAVASPDLAAAFSGTRVMPQTRYESVVRLLAIFAQHLAALAQQMLVGETKAELPAIGRARAFMADHLTDELRLEDVAHAAGLSDFYFCKLFRRATGMTFTHYLARLRVESAKVALRDSGAQVCAVAYDAGFQSLSQFNRVFRRVAGETPTEFRLHMRDGEISANLKHA